MTAIVTDGITVAADSLVSSGRDSIEAWPFAKIIERGERIFACSGDLHLFEPMIAWWLEEPHDPKKMPICRQTDDGCYLWVFENNSLYEIHPHYPYKLKIGYPSAIGSGAKYARGALALGHTPEEAVRAASLCDPGTGGSIQVVTLPEHLRLDRPPKELMVQCTPLFGEKRTNLSWKEL